MVSGSLSSDGGGQGKSSAPQSSYSDIFDALLPQYLFMGMSASEYWDGDNALPAVYRKAHQLRTEERNTELWLQGLYVYEAILRASPVLHAFAKKGAKAMPYLQEPYPLTKEKAAEMAERRERENYKAMKAKMKAQTERINRQSKEGEQKHDNDNRPITN